MSERDYLKLVSKIGKLLSAKEKTSKKLYNLSGSGFQDYYSQSEIAKLEKSNDKNNRKIAGYDQLIREILNVLESNGYDKEDILAQFDTEYTDGILPKKEEKGMGAM